MFIRSIAIATIVAAASMSAANAHTVMAPSADANTARVTYADLNLATPAGEAALYARVTAVAKRLNAPEDVRDVEELTYSQAATAKSIADARAQVAQRVAAAQSGSQVAMRPVAVRALR
jgi:UrcA family protein